jgi:hypothetical protein
MWIIVASVYPDSAAYRDPLLLLQPSASPLPLNSSFIIGTDTKTPGFDAFCSGFDPFCSGSDPFCSGSDAFCSGSDAFCSG